MPPSPCEGSWSSRPGLRPVAPAAGPAPAGPRSPAASAPGTPSSASSGTDGCHAPPRSTSLQEPLVQEHQRLLQTRREQLLQHLPQPDEPPQPRPQLRQLGQRRGRPAPPVEQAIDLLHQPAQAAELRLAAGDPLQRLPLGGAEMALDEQVAVLEQLADLPLDPLLAPGGTLRRLRAGTAPRQLGSAGRQALAHLGHGGEDRLGHLAKDVESCRADAARRRRPWRSARGTAPSRRS